MAKKKNSKKGKRNKGRTVDAAEWREFLDALDQFKQDGTGAHIASTLLHEFPLFIGKAPAGHPYPQAWTEGAIDEKYCYIEEVDEDLVLLRRKLPSGRIISIDTMDFALLNGGEGIAHLNMDNGDNRAENLKRVNEAEARKLLMEFEEEGEVERYKIVTILWNGQEEDNDMRATPSMRELHGWDSDTADLTTACYSFWHLTGKLFQLNCSMPGRLGLKVVQVGTEKVMARLELNPLDQAEKKAAFAALSAAIEATASHLPEENYRQLYDHAKAVFDVCN